jgi:STE24 endopeptidase
MSVEDLAAQTEFPLTKIYKIDGSTRSSHSNAYFYGFFKNKRIVLYDTLIDQCKQEEVVAILGHELGHYFKWHTLSNLVLIQVQLLATFFLFGKFMYTRDLYQSFGFDSMPLIIGFVLFQYIYSPVGHVISTTS